jgi:micrococcal nuclease
MRWQGFSHAFNNLDKSNSRRKIGFSAFMNLLPLTLSSFLVLPAFAHDVIAITDGDTLTLLVSQTPLKVRLANIDAPEKSQAFGSLSKKSLSDLCWGLDATFETKNIDRYGRTVAEVICGGVKVNRAQVERGMAWVYRKYNEDPSMPALEERARENRVGLWSDINATPPWEFRRARRTTESKTLR